MASNKNASKKAMAKKAARKKALAKKASSGRFEGTSAFDRDTPRSSPLLSFISNNAPFSNYNRIGFDQDIHAAPGVSFRVSDQGVAVSYADEHSRDRFNAQVEQMNQAQTQDILRRFTPFFEKTKAANEAAGINYFLLKIKLKNAPHPLWRRIVVPADYTCSQLHEEIQEVFGWDQEHLASFSLDDKRGNEFSVAYTSWDFGPDPELKEVMTEGRRIGYLYNFFHEHNHVIEVEKAMVNAADYDPSLPIAQGKAIGPFADDNDDDDAVESTGFKPSFTLVDDDDNDEYEDDDSEYDDDEYDDDDDDDAKRKELLSATLIDLLDIFVGLNDVMEQTHKEQNLSTSRFRADKQALQGRSLFQDFGQSLAEKTFVEPSCYYQLKVTLKDTSSPCWRRIVIPDTARLSDLHDEIKWRFDHFGPFMAQFYWPKHRMNIAETSGESNEEYLLEPDYQLKEVLQEGMRLTYTFDFNRGYEHTIEVEKVLARPEDMSKRLSMGKGDLSLHRSHEGDDYDDDEDEDDI